MSQELLIKKLSTVLEISKAMMAVRDLDELLNLIVEKASEILEAERASIFLVDHDTQELWSRVAQAAEVAEIRFPWNKGIAGSVVQHRNIINIKDAYQDPRFNPEIDKKTGYRTKSILCGPLINHKDEVIGALQVLNKKQGIFTDHDESLITALAAQVAIAVENAHLYEELELTFKSFLKTLASAIDSRDPVTAGHSERVGRYALNIGQALGLSEQELKVLEYAAALHDLGKIGVRDNVLLKPGKLNPEEFEEMKNHAAKTKEIVENMYLSRELSNLAHIAAAHHERLDGSGYPLGLTGEQISQAACIIAVADVFDALVAYDRPYKRAMTIEEAFKILDKEKSTKFDAEIVDVFRNRKLYEIERRVYPRAPLNIPIEYIVQPDKKQLDETPLSSETLSISGSGLVFISRRLIPLGATINLTLHLPLTIVKDTEKQKMQLSGKVVRCDRKSAKGNYFIGTKFINMTKQEHDKLAEIIDQADAAGTK